MKKRFVICEVPSREIIRKVWISTGFHNCDKVFWELTFGGQVSDGTIALDESTSSKIALNMHTRNGVVLEEKLKSLELILRECPK